MADNIDVTPGTGKTVATDDCGAAGHTQVVKLAISTDGSATPIPADGTYGLAVDVKRVIGNVPAIGPTAHDAAVSMAPVVTGGVASAAAPSSVSADGDVVQAWHLRNGAQATVITAAGALVGGDAANGLDVDVTRLSIEAVDNAAFTDGTTKVVPAGYVFDEVAGTALTENDVAAARVDSKRAVVNVLEDATTRGQRAAIDSSGRLSTLPAGGVAHDGVDSGNPVKVGTRAVSSLASATMVSAADRADAVSDLDGALLSRPGFPLGDLLSERVTNTDGSSTAFTTFGAAGSGVRLYVTAIVVYNSSGTAGTIDFRDGTGGSVLFTVPIPAGGGCVIANGGVPLFRTTANTALAYDVSAALSTVTISISGFKSKV